MPSPRIRIDLPIPNYDGLRAEFDVPGDFPPEVLAEAERAAAAPRLPLEDLTDVPFLTIDPPGSTDLDQAMALSHNNGGFRVLYAIADVAAFVIPGGAVDREAHRRGETFYAPDEKTSLHPPVLSEGAGSLLQDQLRPALVWTLDLDHTGDLTASSVSRALVRSRRRLDYETVQQQIDEGTATPDLQLLQVVGALRLAHGRARGAVDLPTPEQEVTEDGKLQYRAQLPSERWNAQISLLAGIAAAAMMIEGRIGLLRTLPPPDPEAVTSLRRSALALGLSWPESTSYGDVVSALDPADPAAAALLSLATRLLRGAGYTAFDGELPAQAEHSAVASPYAHCTAPLRRMADRYVGEICLSLRAGTPVPQWVREALPRLPEEMAAADQRARALDRAVVELAEALVLSQRVGETFEGVVVDVGGKGGTVQLTDPAVRGRLDGVELPLGKTVQVVLVEADPVKRAVRFALASPL